MSLFIETNRNAIQSRPDSQTFQSFAIDNRETGAMTGTAKQPSVARQQRLAAMIQWQVLMRAGIDIRSEDAFEAYHENRKIIQSDAARTRFGYVIPMA